MTTMCVCLYASVTLVVPLDFTVSQPAKGTVAAMYGQNKLLPASAMEAALARYLDLLYKVKPADASTQ